jgi:hypothetical protein
MSGEISEIELAAAFRRQGPGTIIPVNMMYYPYQPLPTVFSSISSSVKAFFVHFIL